MTPTFPDHSAVPTVPFMTGAVRTTRRGMVLVSLGVIAMISIAANAQSTGDGGLNSLEDFIKTTKSGRASFPRS